MSVNLQVFRGKTCKEYRLSHSTQGSISSWENTIHTDFVSKFTVLCNQAYNTISFCISVALYIHCKDSSNCSYVLGTGIRGSFSTISSTPPTWLKVKQFLARNQNFFWPQLWKVVIFSPLKKHGQKWRGPLSFVRPTWERELPCKTPTSTWHCCHQGKPCWVMWSEQPSSITHFGQNSFPGFALPVFHLLQDSWVWDRDDTLSEIHATTTCFIVQILLK